jgi:hypothetical protein
MLDEIEFTKWNSFFESINQRNRWRPTRLQVFGLMGNQEAEEGLPLVGLSLDTKAEGGPRVFIKLGEHDITDTRHLTHAISNVTHVMLKKGSDGRDEAVEIENVCGERNLLHFQPSPTFSTIRG